MGATKERFRALPITVVLNRAEVQKLGTDWVKGMRAASAVFPSRINTHALNELINWRNVPNDPMFQVLVPQPGMLSSDQHDLMQYAFDTEDPTVVQAASREIRKTLNPNVSNQIANVPRLASGASLPGVQHKYAETLLLFPKNSQTCHAYCTYCFRFPQFSGPTDNSYFFATNDYEGVARYIDENPNITDLLITGGDPMIISAEALMRIVKPFLRRPGALRNIRIGTRALSFWPQRFTTDTDADALFRVFDEISRSGLAVALMAHISCPAEMQNTAFENAVARLCSNNVIIRSQSPILRHVNDNVKNWRDLWSEQVRLGIIPYYMFIERNTGAHGYFALPIMEAWQIFTESKRSVSGLARTVRGPCMSTNHGKLEVVGPCEVSGSKSLVLRYIQARDATRVNVPFVVKLDNKMVWHDG